MSGCHFDYIQHKIQNTIEDIARDEDVKALNMPKLHKLLIEVGGWFHGVIHDLDWDVSGDASIKDTAKYEEEQIAKFKRIIRGNTTHDLNIKPPTYDTINESYNPDAGGK